MTHDLLLNQRVDSKKEFQYQLPTLALIRTMARNLEEQHIGYNLCRIFYAFHTLELLIKLWGDGCCMWRHQRL
jgi:hypothetical protein